MSKKNKSKNKNNSKKNSSFQSNKEKNRDVNSKDKLEIQIEKVKKSKTIENIGKESKSKQKLENNLEHSNIRSSNGIKENNLKEVTKEKLKKDKSDNILNNDTKENNLKVTSKNTLENSKSKKNIEKENYNKTKNNDEKVKSKNKSQNLDNSKQNNKKNNIHFDDVNKQDGDKKIQDKDYENENSIIKVKETTVPKLLEKEEKREKKKTFILVIFIFLSIFILIFSVIFAFLNVTKTVIIDGVIVKNIDVSNLTPTEAKTKITNAFNIELNTPIKIVSKDYETTLNTNQIEFSYDIAKAIQEAYSVGRNGNIFENNYTILKTGFFGKEIEIDYSYNEDALDYIINDIESKIPGLVTQVSYYREGDELVIVPGVDGIRINKEKLKENIINTILTANAIDLKENNTKLQLDIPIENVKAENIDITKIRSEIYTEPKDAYYESDPFKIYAEVEGIDFAISNEEAIKLIKDKQNEYRIPLKVTPASKTINDIGLEAFPYLISDFSTKYDASNINRSQNLAIAAGKINGTVLMPGDEFSFNKVVGKRTIEEGYKDAKIYQDGKVVDGLAGGICQISSTLYNAVVKANLEVLERKNHSFTTSYIRAGQDATVVYGVKDFRFKNTRNYPIKISADVNSGIAEFKIYGIKEEVEYDISLSPVTTGSIPYTTEYIPDPTLAPGQQVVVQGGGNGLKVTTYKDTKLDGKLISREVISNDTYSPMKAIIRVGQ